MGKHDFFAPKAIANRIKSKGLGKLRWFCQVCSKQCRDENGYQSHIQSESHQRKLLLVADNPNKFVDGYSSEFLDGFLGLLSKRYGTRRVFANHVYQEYISDKSHCHMNATKWATLSEFVMYLGKRGFVRVEENEKGWFIEWIDNSPKELARKESILKQDRMKRDQEERDRVLIEEQIEKSKASTSQLNRKSEPVELVKRNDEKIVIHLGEKKLFNGRATKHAISAESEEGESSSTASKKQKVETSELPTLSWIMPQIVVKIINKDFANGQYYGKKGVIQKVFDGNVAEILLLDSGDIVRLDESQLETVIPKNTPVMLLKHPWRGKQAKIVEIKVAEYKAVLEVMDTLELVELEYQWFSKIY